MVPAQGPQRSPIDLVAGIAAILTVAVQLLRSCLSGSGLIWFHIPGTHLLIGNGRYGLLSCQLATTIGAISLMTSGHRSPTARTVATLGIGAMFCFGSIAVLAAQQVSACPNQAMAQGAVPYQNAVQVPMQFPGMPQPGLPQPGIAPETIVRQPGSPQQPGMPQQATPSAPISAQAVPQQGISPGNMPSGGSAPAASGSGYPDGVGQQFGAPPATDIAGQEYPSRF